MDGLQLRAHQQRAKRTNYLLHLAYDSKYVCLEEKEHTKWIAVFLGLKEKMQNYTATLVINCCLWTAAGKTALCPSAFRQLVSSVLHLRWWSSSVFIHILDKIKVNHCHDLLSAEKNLYISFLQKSAVFSSGIKALSRRHSPLGRVHV